MPKAVITFVFEVYGMDCWRTHLTHAQICDNVRVQSTTEWIVFSPFSRFRRFRVFAFSFFPVSVLGVFAFSRFRVFVFRRRHPRGRDTDFVCTDSWYLPFWVWPLPSNRETRIISCLGSVIPSYPFMFTTFASWEKGYTQSISQICMEHIHFM